MAAKMRQRGEGRAGCAFWVFILAIAALIGFKVVPVKYKSSQFYDFMYEQAKYAQQSRPPDIKKELMRKARELDLPIDPKKVTVRKRGGRIQIYAEYTVNLEFPGYTYVWNFEEEIDEPIFIW